MSHLRPVALIGATALPASRFVDRRSRRLAYARTCWGWRGMPRESRMRRGVALGGTGLRDRGLAVAGAGRIGVLVIPAKCAT